MDAKLSISNELKCYSFLGDAHKGELEIKGIFTLEKIGAVFIPVFEWVQNLHTFSKNREFKVIFKIKFANTPAKHMFRHIILLLNEQAKNHNFVVTVYWLYEENNKNKEDEAEALRDDYSHNITIRLVEVDSMISVL